MKMSRFILAAGALLASSAALAASHDLATFIGEYDLNRDGSVSKEEFQKERERTFAAADVNRDGFLSLEEYRDEFRARLMYAHPEPAAIDREMTQLDVRFRVLDSNHDGRMSAAEYFSSGWKMFDEHDYNKDGAVSMADKT